MKNNKVDIEELFKLYFSNKSDKEIAEIYNVTAEYIHQLRAAYGLLESYRVEWDDEVVRNYILYEAKKSNTLLGLSKVLDLAPSTARKALIRYSKQGWVSKELKEKYAIQIFR